MSRVKTAMDAQDLDLAIKLLDAILELRPSYAEAWNRRATVYFLKKDYAQSLTDIRQVLAREPRHFGAIAGLGMIMQEFGEEKRALEAFRRALEVHPHLQKIPELVKGLTEKVDGRDI
jgi:tetratricopeptide (TPR) repeat protein